MDNAKIENLLNLAMSATEEEREKSLNLSVGFDPLDEVWEVVVKYNGDIFRILQDFSEVEATPLGNEYAILLIPEGQVDAVASLPRIEYMEKPKRLFFALNEAKRASCITAVQNTSGINTGKNPLTGRRVLVGVADSGIDYSHPDFCNPDGTTRILRLWDQTLNAAELNVSRTEVNEGITYHSPAGYRQGVVFTEEEINLALQQPDISNQYKIVPSRDISGHGTHVTGIAAGNGRASMGRYRGVAYEAKLIIVKLGNPKERSFPKTTELMEAVDYCIRIAAEVEMPLALNLSFGNNYGSHSGGSLLETYLNAMADRWKCSIVTGTGNDGAERGHRHVEIKADEVIEEELAVGAYEAKLNVQIWKLYQDEIGVEVILPNGSTTGLITRKGTSRVQFSDMELLLFYGEPLPYSIYQELYIDMIPRGDYIPEGVFKIRFTSGRILNGTVEMWLPAGGVLSPSTGFLYPTEEQTLTIPSTAQKVISVSAYDSGRDTAAAFSGRGFTAWTRQIKPDIAAPGVGIVAPAPGGTYVVRSGTSMATPFVTGGAALLMEWGIVNGNDVFLYGEKMKAYLINGARQLPGAWEWPNGQLGWGALCVADSLPG